MMQKQLDWKTSQTKVLVQFTNFLDKYTILNSSDNILYVRKKYLCVLIICAGFLKVIEQNFGRFNKV